jgi:hypothetical protein
VWDGVGVEVVTDTDAAPKMLTSSLSKGPTKIVPADMLVESLICGSWDIGMRYL